MGFTEGCVTIGLRDRLGLYPFYMALEWGILCTDRSYPNKPTSPVKK